MQFNWNLKVKARARKQCSEMQATPPVFMKEANGFLDTRGWVTILISSPYMLLPELYIVEHILFSMKKSDFSGHNVRF